MKAIWNNTVIAESNKTVVLEGNHYFPPESVKAEYLEKAKQHQFAHGKVQPITIQSKSMIP